MKTHFSPMVENGLKELSEIILKEKNNLSPNLDDLAQDLASRSSRLWYSYFSRGICLSNGGVHQSIIKMSDIKYQVLLRSFNKYMVDEEPLLNQKLLKQFLVDEGAISIDHTDQLSVAFCLGSHEGAMRAARCIYNKNANNGILFPSGAYGLLAVSLNDLKPFKFNIATINIEKNNKEKIDLTDLNRLIKSRPTYKTLLLDLKTTMGSIYTVAELEGIIKICKENNVFLFADAAHNNMHFSNTNTIPNITEVCLRLDFHEYLVMYTASKTYGLERARVGYIVLDNKCKSLSLERMENDLTRVFGTISDLPIHAANALLKTPVSIRKDFLKKQRDEHWYNMNLMITYIEGTQSNKIDPALHTMISAEIPKQYHIGTHGLSIVYKPDCGIQMKISMIGLKNMFFTNIRMFNSEIFSYALNKVAGVVTLHSYQIMDESGYSMRLSYSIKEDVHKGMRAINDFIWLLHPYPSQNIYLPHVKLVEKLIFPTKFLPTKNSYMQSSGTLFSVKSNKHENVQTKKQLKARL